MKIQFTKKAVKDMKGLPKDVQKRVIAILQRIQINPWKYARRLSGTIFYRIRVGEYRIIADIGDERITVLRVGHRRKIYRGLL